MPFSEKIRRQEIRRAGGRCESCGEKLTSENPPCVHSSTGGHSETNNDTGLLIYRDLPPRFAHLNREPVSLVQYPSLRGRQSDARVICSGCHNRIHIEALEKTRELFPLFRGHYPPPSILFQVTESHIHNDGSGLAGVVPEKVKPSQQKQQIVRDEDSIAEARKPVLAMVEVSLFGGVGSDRRGNKRGNRGGYRAYISDGYQLPNLQLKPRGQGR